MFLFHVYDRTPGIQGSARAYHIFLIVFLSELNWGTDNLFS